MDSLPLMLAVDEESLIVVTLLVGGAVIWIVTSNVRRYLEVRAKERTRREVAAYVAEGTIQPADARSLLETQDKDCEKAIADAVAWGCVNPEKAERLIKAMREQPSA